MSMTREIYWNVGHGVVLPMYLLVIVACAIMVWGFWQRLAVWQQGKPLDRLDRKGERIKRMLAEVFGLSRVVRVKAGGLPHSLFFWSFMTLFVGTLLIMLQADFMAPVLDMNILSGPFYLGFSLSLDLAGLLALLMLFWLLYRRLIVKPEGLETEAGDYWIHGLLVATLITGFLIEG
ncbi:MAG: electron transporter, partial [Desulfuromonadales bacterium]|nr:electron transporter [Desulfuromonadales bacterium]